MVEEGYGAEVLLEVVPLIALLYLHERVRQHDSEMTEYFVLRKKVCHMAPIIQNEFSSIKPPGAGYCYFQIQPAGIA